MVPQNAGAPDARTPPADSKTRNHRLNNLCNSRCSQTANRRPLWRAKLVNLVNNVPCRLPLMVCVAPELLGQLKTDCHAGLLR